MLIGEKAWDMRYARHTAVADFKLRADHRGSNMQLFVCLAFKLFSLVSMKNLIYSVQKLFNTVQWLKWKILANDF